MFICYQSNSFFESIYYNYNKYMFCNIKKLNCNSFLTFKIFFIEMQHLHTECHHKKIQHSLKNNMFIQLPRNTKE
ncbi:hypothetical protein NUSPORA_01905 [Nucleospora cyclopteri]